MKNILLVATLGLLFGISLQGVEMRGIAIQNWREDFPFQWKKSQYINDRRYALKKQDDDHGR